MYEEEIIPSRRELVLTQAQADQLQEQIEKVRKEVEFQYEEFAPDHCNHLWDTQLHGESKNVATDEFECPICLAIVLEPLMCSKVFNGRACK